MNETCLPPAGESDRCGAEACTRKSGHGSDVASILSRMRIGARKSALLRRAHDRSARPVTLGDVALASHLRLDLRIGCIAMIGVDAIVVEAKDRHRCRGQVPVIVSGSEM